MKYNAFDITAEKTAKRVGRGISAGQGKTAGRGTKGQKSRAGSSRRPGFEGGQNPLIQRLPKLRGFNSHRAKIENVDLADLNSLKTTLIDNNSLASAGLISSPYVRAKLIGQERVTKKLTVKLQAASESAIKAIVKAGGSFSPIGQVGRLAKKTAPKADKAS
jgi:large subunit ribosomal protein L15